MCVHVYIDSTPLSHFRPFLLPLAPFLDSALPISSFNFLRQKRKEKKICAFKKRKTRMKGVRTSKGSA